MTPTDEPRAFVKEALSRGVSRAEIEQVLLQSGWSRRQAAEALAAFCRRRVPHPRSAGAAKHARQHRNLLFRKRVGHCPPEATPT
jgi:hypothetical protein